MKSKKSFYIKKISAVALAFAVGITSSAGNVPVISQASSTFHLTKKVTVGAGEPYQLTTKGNTKGITFLSSDKKIVSVSKTGKIKGKKAGKATITAKVNKKSKKCVVTVKKAPKAIKITNGNLELYTESMEQLSVKFTSGYSNKVTFKSGNKAVAKVSSKGLVTAVGEGITTITATTFNGKKAQITCKVIDDQKETAAPTTEPTTSVTATISPTAIVTAVVSTTPSSTPANTETTSTPVVTEAPTATAANIPTLAATATTTPSSVPVPTQVATVAPTNTPIATEATTTTSSSISASPTATPDVVTTSAVISKIEGNTIYINENQSILNLTNCITYFKGGHQITLQELAVGDTVTITYSGLTAETLPSLLIECKKIEVTKSKSRIIHAATIESLTERSMFLKDLPYYLSYSASVTKVYKDGQEIAWNDLKIGDTIRLNCTYYGSNDPEIVGFVDQINTIVVLDDTISQITPSTTPTITPTYPDVSAAPLKPVIYLYPEDETEVSVDLDFQGDFTYTYPYTEDGSWDVVAKPDGTIINKADNNEYSYLFWEGVAWDFTADFSEGFCVKGEDTTEFLRTVLSQMGLTPKEYNEFIVYWAPQLQNNPYNLISFQTENYEQMAPLKVNPAPDSMLRVYMAYKPLTEAVAIPEQTFTPFERKGFTVVEWGGCIITDTKVK